MFTNNSHITNEPLRGQHASKPGWNSCICGGVEIIGYIGINKLHRNEDGTISILSVFAVMLLTMLLGMVMNVGRQVDGKLRMQNAADAAAYSGGVVLARGMNSLAFTNHLLCDVFATTAFLREARDRNAESYVPAILAAWAKEGPIFEGSKFAKFSALGPAITKKVPMEQELVRSYSKWVNAVSDVVLPLMEEILSQELIPQYQRAVAVSFPDIAQAATMEVALRNGQPDFGRGAMLGAFWRTSGQLVGGDELTTPTLPVVDPELGMMPNQTHYTDKARDQRKNLSEHYLNDWNNQTLAFFDYAGKMSQFASLWRSFTCGHLHNLLENEYPTRNLPFVIRAEADEVLDGNTHLEQYFTFLGVVYWKKVPELAAKLFRNPIESDSVAYAEVRMFIPQRRLVWWRPLSSGHMPIGGVPGEFPSLPDEDPTDPGQGPGERWVVTRQPGASNDWSLLNQRWTCQLTPTTQPALATILQTVPELPAFAGQNFVLPKLGNLSTDDIGRISTH